MISPKKALYRAIKVIRMCTRFEILLLCCKYGADGASLLALAVAVPLADNMAGA